MNTSTLNRRTFTTVAVMAAASVAVPVLWAQPRLEKIKISIAVAGKTSLYYLPLTIAEQLGYFKAEGLEVEMTDFASGTADVMSGAFENTINLQSRGQRFQAFVLQGRAPAISMGVSLKTMPYYKSVSDLKGKKIGISAPGSSSNLVANLILSRAGLKAADVSFLGVGSGAGALAAWRSGQVDAMCNVDPVMTMLEQKGEIRIIADTCTLKGTADLLGGAMPAACLYAPIEFIQKNPNTVQALTHAIVHSLKWLQTAGPSDIIKTVPEACLLGDRALYLAAFNKVREAISPDGLFPLEGPPNAVMLLSSLDPAVKAGHIKLSETYTNEFAQKAKAYFKA
jgi:NitT/TauT family transport system substrate-binding protein